MCTPHKKPADGLYVKFRNHPFPEDDEEENDDEEDDENEEDEEEVGWVTANPKVLPIYFFLSQLTVFLSNRLMIYFLNPWLVTGGAVITSIRNMSKKSK